MTQASNPYNRTDDHYKEARDVWADSARRQEFEHDLINRKTTWSLTGQTILFAAYGVSLRSDFVDKSNEFRNVVALSGLAVAVVTFAGVLAIGVCVLNRGAAGTATNPGAAGARLAATAPWLPPAS